MTMRYRLRTLLMVLAIAPPVLAAAWFAALWLADAERYWTFLFTLAFFANYILGLTLAVWVHNRWVG